MTPAFVQPASENSSSGSSSGSSSAPATLLIILVVTRVGYRLIIPADAISTDMIHWDRVSAALLQGHNPYVVTSQLNHPPFWMQVIFVLNFIGDALDLSLATLIYTLLVSAEAGVVIFAHKLIRDFAGARRAFRVCLWGVVLNPALLLQTIQHGNFDVLLALAIMIAIWLAQRHRRTAETAYWLFATLLLGIAAWIKTVPLLLAPVILTDAKLPRVARFLGILLLLLPITVATSVIFSLAPAAVADNVLRYRSTPGYYGLTGIAQLLGNAATAQFVQKVTAITPIIIFVTALLVLRKRSLDTPRFALAVGLILLALPTVGPGYAAQYVHWWFCPLLVATVAMSRGERRLFWIMTGILAATYCVEYALFPSHGAVLFAFLPADSGLRAWGDRMDTPAWQTIVRLPLFVIQAMSVGVFTFSLVRSPRIAELQ